MRTPFAIVVALVACASPKAAPSPSPTASAAPVASVAPLLTVTPDAAPDTSCGALDCHLYASARDAMQAVLVDDPLVVAIGEAHAQKGTEGIASSAKRFTAELLPLLQDRASDLLVELMMPPKGCAAQTKEVRKRQEPVTQNQAESNQDEYMAMGTAARALHIVPDLLRPSCKDFDEVTKATGADAIDKMLQMIAKLTTQQIKALLARADHDPKKAIVVYGGALHGDVDPPPSRAAWSFAADVAPLVKGRYVSVQLFVPEFIGDDDVWKKFAWYEHFDKKAHPDKATMYRPKPNAYVIIFPASAPSLKR